MVDVFKKRSVTFYAHKDGGYLHISCEITMLFWI